MHISSELTWAMIVSWLLLGGGLIYNLGGIASNLKRMASDLTAVSEQLKEHSEWTRSQMASIERRIWHLESFLPDTRRPQSP